MGMVASPIRKPGLELSQGRRSLGLGLPEAVTSQALGILSLFKELGLGHPDSDQVQTQHLRQDWSGASEPLFGALSLCQSTQDEVLLEVGWLGSRKKDLVVEVS